MTEGEREDAIRDLAIGEGFDVDGGCQVSEGDENGAYVQVWTWIPFDGTALDKESGNENPS